MSDQTVFVTGAGGFIGSRLVHRISLGEEMDVRALVHHVSGPNAMRLARLPIDIEQGSILDAQRMDDLIADCDAVVHCAFGDKTATVDGTKIVLNAADRHDIDTFVHLSTAAVHGIDFDETIDESAPFDPQTPYAEAKAEAERFVTSFDGRSDLSSTVLRPFIVYGPYGNFVERPVREIKQGAILADGGFGRFNQVYVDNLVDAILLALNQPEARGETFLVVDDEDVSWREYYHRLAAVVGDHPPIKDLSVKQIRLKRKSRYLRDSVWPPFEVISDVVSSGEVQSNVASTMNQAPWARSAFQALPSGVKSDILERLGGSDRQWFSTENGVETNEMEYVLPDKRYERLHASTGGGKNAHMKEMLGWRQRVTFDEAMELIEGWARYEERA